MKNSFSVFNFCVEECKRQNDFSQESINNMVYAYNWAILQENLFTLDNIAELGRLVKPDKNASGFRCTPVIFLNGNRGVDYRQIERLLTILCESSLTADEFYKEFESIHPFADGNGRVGAILWNIINGTIDIPISPPDMF